MSRELTSRAEPLAFVANPGTDTELWVYRNKEQRDLIFAFRCALVCALSCAQCVHKTEIMEIQWETQTMQHIWWV